ncbi:MAG: glycosyltransferase family 4 protein [Candidatus Saccharibacteria bacterium]|nr:glycosyltransferase family 4 protein [Candidatus Saccharibacteria bacterium]
MKYEVVLFQPYLRQFVLNFGKHLRRGSFRLIANPPKQTGYASLPGFDQEIKRTKLTLQNRIRRFFGIPNVRLWFRSEGDILFTYACLIITNKPYCTYLETGLALYNYDLGIAKNPIARFIVILLATRRNCKKLIFLSEASRKSFFATIQYPAWVRRNFEAKSVVIYPVPTDRQRVLSKKFSGSLKLLFPGTFYIKGGLEVAHAYERLRKSHTKVELTIVTALHMISQEDRRYLESLPGLTLLDAKLKSDEMADLYRTHDLFLLPTYRDGFGLVVIEALAYGMPVIVTDQYAVPEMVQEQVNGFVFHGHPLKDYDSQTYKLLGKYYNPSDFYRDLFQLQREKKLRPIEDFLVESVEKFIKKPELLSQYSQASLDLYHRVFDEVVLGDKLEAVFAEALR